MSEPCQLWPNQPWPHWLQTPIAIFGLLFLGALFGWQTGVMFTHFYHYKVKLWLERGAVRDGGKERASEP